MGAGSGVLQDDGEQGDAHGAADLLGDAGDDTRVRDLLVPQPDVGGAHRRDHGGAERDAADEQRGHEHGPAGAGGGEGERDRGHGDEGERGDGDPARADAVHVPARQGACEQRPHTLRDER